LLQGGGDAGEGRDRGAGGGRDGPWATQGMSMRYGEIVCVCVCVCVTHTLSLSLSLSPPLSLCLSLSLAFSCCCCAPSHNAQSRAHTPTPTPNITPTLVQRAGMPRFLRKPLSGEQGTRQGRITSLPHPPHIHKSTRPPSRTCTHTSAHIRICVWRAGDTRREHHHPPTQTHADTKARTHTQKHTRIHTHTAAPSTGPLIEDRKRKKTWWICWYLEHVCDEWRFHS
jgi:hypothetical protein